jgi:hypothetical protein
MEGLAELSELRRPEGPRAQGGHSPSIFLLYTGYEGGQRVQEGQGVHEGQGRQGGLVESGEPGDTGWETMGDTRKTETRTATDMDGTLHTDL